MQRRQLLQVAGLTTAAAAAGGYYLATGPFAEEITSEPPGEESTALPDLRHARLEETFFTDAEGENIDTPAVWHGDDEHHLLVTAKESHELVRFDATDGSYLGSIGEEGSDLGHFARPNEIRITSDLAIVTERDNQRVQVLRLPDGEPLGSFGEEHLRRPYGCAIVETDNGYDLYVTDDYDAEDADELDERVKQYRLQIRDDELSAELVGTFGETDEPGALGSVETIYADPAHDRIVIADEADSALTIYDLSGSFETVLASFSGYDPEGIALYDDGDGGGAWICTEQSRPSRFHVFDRLTLNHRLTFEGEHTEHTDGVWLTQASFGPFEVGAFFAVHDDERPAAFDLGELLAHLP